MTLPGPRLVCGCAPGEQHELGLLMFALLMEQHGWEVIYLGQGLASDGLAGFLMKVAPALVCLSVSLVEHMPGMLELCKVVQSLEQHRLGLAFSGRSFLRYPELRDRVPGVFLGTDMRSAVVVAHGLGEMIDPERWYNAATPQYRIGPAFGHIEGV